MTTPPSDPRPDDGRLPPWAGAPGFTPGIDDLPPHAPMPGAPPYPDASEHGPPPVGQSPRRTRFGAVLGAACIWAAVNLGLVLVVTGVPGGAPVITAVGGLLGGLIVPALLAALAVWVIARRRVWPFWLLVLATAPLFWVLRAVLMALPVT